MTAEPAILCACACEGEDPRECPDASPKTCAPCSRRASMATKEIALMPRVDVSAPFLSTIAGSTWADSHLVTPFGPRWLGVFTSPALGFVWTTGTPTSSPPCGRGLPEAIFDLLRRATANDDGSFVVDGVAYELLDRGPRDLVTCEPGPPPPPPEVTP